MVEFVDFEPEIPQRLTGDAVVAKPLEMRDRSTERVVEGSRPSSQTYAETAWRYDIRRGFRSPTSSSNALLGEPPMAASDG